MSNPTDPAGSAKAALRAALFDYSHAPGKYQVAMRQPAPLFAALREVLQLAVGREGDAPTGRAEAEAASLRDAARFFVRTALLYPGADHYALLGVDRKADNADLKDRYRLMMRLLHPDFAGPAAGAWPPDAAVRVNRAYDTLSSAVARRLYDETLAPMQGVPAASGPDPRRVRPMVVPPETGTRESHFKTLAIACAVAGAGLVIVILVGTSSQESAHLVQRARVDQVATQAVTEPSSSPVARLQEMLVQVLPAQEPPPPPPPKAVAVAVARAVPAPPPAQLAGRPMVTLPQPDSAPVRTVLASASDSPSNPKPEPAPIAVTPAVAVPAQSAATIAPAPPPPSPTVPAAAQVAPAPPPPKPSPKPGPTLVEAQPLLAQLLQSMESGRGDRILTVLDPEARNKPSAQALSRQYDSLVDGARPVRVSNVELKAEPGEGRLLVVGYFRVLAGEQPIGAVGKRMVLRAEFVSRDGSVVITGLSGGLVN